MAARSEVPEFELVDLSELAGNDLDALLEEEIDVWQSRFQWDFRPAADLLRRFLHIRSLLGCALRVNGQVAGYTYCVSEGRKALIGDLYLRSAHWSRAREMQLLSGAVDLLTRQGPVRRIESQLMLLGSPPGTPLPKPELATRHERLFMQITGEAALRMRAVAPACSVSFLPWSDRNAEEAAHLLASCYRGHVDGEINDQYRNIPGARTFLTNITRYPGCGRFSPASSLFAVDQSTGRVCGMALTSHIAEHSGHITQLCVLPALRHSGIGHELIRQSLALLVGTGCNNVSLTVTTANDAAIRLYESLGFTAKASFPALVWDGI